jgi:hypothetical protein
LAHFWSFSTNFGSFSPIFAYFRPISPIFGSFLTYQVAIVDLGCGFGGLLTRLAPLFPATPMLGLEIRGKVADYVGRRTAWFRECHEKRGEDGWVIFGSFDSPGYGGHFGGKFVAIGAVLAEIWFFLWKSLFFFFFFLGMCFFFFFFF